jgi:hypothetical protein
MNDKLAEQNARSHDEIGSARPRWRRFDRIEDLDRTAQEVVGEAEDEYGDAAVI